MTPAVTAAKRAGIEFEVLQYDASDAAEPWGTGAARALGVAPERVFKTLVVDLSGASLAVAIVPVAARLDLKAVAAALGAKRAAMAEPGESTTAASFSAPPLPRGDRLRLCTPESRSGVASGPFEALVPGTEPCGQAPVVGPGVSVADQLLVHHDAAHGHEADDAGVLVTVEEPELGPSSPDEPRECFAGLASPGLVVLGRVHVGEADREPAESPHVRLDAVAVDDAHDPARQRLAGEPSLPWPRCAGPRASPFGVSPPARTAPRQSTERGQDEHKSSYPREEFRSGIRHQLRIQFGRLFRSSCQREL